MGNSTSSFTLGLRAYQQELAAKNKEKLNMKTALSVKEQISRQSFEHVGWSTPRHNVRRIKTEVVRPHFTNMQPDMNRVVQILEQDFWFEDITVICGDSDWSLVGSISKRHWEQQLFV